MKTPYKLGILATVLAAVLWSTGGLFIKLIDLNAYSILWYRSAFCIVTFLIIFRKKALRFSRLSVVSAFFYLPLLLCFVLATKMTTAANAIFLQYTAPAYVLLLEPLLLKVKLQKINMLTLAGCFGGMVLFFLGDFESVENSTGIILAAISGVMLAGLILSQKMNDQKFHASGIVLGNGLVMLVTSPMMMSDALPSTTDLSMLAFLGIVQIGFGYVLFLYGQRYIQAIESALIAMIEPILNPVWVAIGYGEIPAKTSIIGGIIIISMLSLRLLYFRRKAVSPVKTNVL